MIEIACDACERRFEVDPESGPKVSCPYCGDVNRVAAAPVAAPAAAPRGRAPEPANDDGAERELRVVRPAMARAHPFRFSLLVLLFVAGAGLAIAAPLSAALAIGFVGVGIAMALGATLWWLVWWIRATLWIKIVITNKRTIRHEGIVRRHSTEVLHDHVRSVDINQTFFQRLFNVGYIGIDSAGQDDIEVEIRDIPAPYEVKKLIDRHRKM